LIVTTYSASSGRSRRRQVWVPTGRRGKRAIPSCPCWAPTGQRWRTSPTWPGHRGTTTTETAYRKVIVPELRRGAEVMDRLFVW